MYSDKQQDIINLVQRNWKWQPVLSTRTRSRHTWACFVTSGVKYGIANTSPKTEALYALMMTWEWDHDTNKMLHGMTTPWMTVIDTGMLVYDSSSVYSKSPGSKNVKKSVISVSSPTVLGQYSDMSAKDHTDMSIIHLATKLYSLYGEKKVYHTPCYFKL